MIYITEKAAKKIEEIALEEGLDHRSVRVMVKGGGCAGFTYDMNYDNIVNELDETFTMDNVTIVVDALSMQYLDEVTIDYIDSMLGGGFKFLNPNSTGSCGCGSSFSA